MANLAHDAHPIPPEIENAIADFADGISEAVDATIGTPEWQSATHKKDAAWAAMKVAIAELTRDSERLDWIEVHGLPDPKVHDGHTLRQAIDDEKESPAAAVERGVRETTGQSGYPSPAPKAELDAFLAKVRATPLPEDGGGNPDGCWVHDEYTPECDLCTGWITQKDVDLVRRVAQASEPELHRVADRLTSQLAGESDATRSGRRPSDGGEND